MCKYLKIKVLPFIKLNIITRTHTFTCMWWRKPGYPEKTTNGLPSKHICHIQREEVRANMGIHSIWFSLSWWQGHYPLHHIIMHRKNELGMYTLNYNCLSYTLTSKFCSLKIGRWTINTDDNHWKVSFLLGQHFRHQWKCNYKVQFTFVFRI